jgi:EAL domain-containing protein (putative c-di-GMP-specific phosphodiesterase class I)/CHASE3 domain sensor protein
VLTPHTRVIALVGGAALVASITIGGVFFETNAVEAALQSDQATAARVQVLGDQLLAAVQDQSESLDEYLLSGDPEPLARYRKAVAEEATTAAGIGAGSAYLVGITEALTQVDRDNRAWQTGVAEPAIKAMLAGSKAGIAQAIAAAIADHEVTQAATIALVARIDAVQAGLVARSYSLDGFRLAAAGLGIAIELAAAALSLWFVRRYGRAVDADLRRREHQNAERIEIVASLRTLRSQASPEATATSMAEALNRLPGVHAAAVYEVRPEGLLALAACGLPGFPIQSGQWLPRANAEHLRRRAEHEPWAEPFSPEGHPAPYEKRLLELGIKTRAFAPIELEGELIGLISVATSDEAQGRHLVEDLPAVSEFASLAETILAPFLVARRDRGGRQQAVAATIRTEAFHPVFQPVVDLATAQHVGFEALTRFADGTPPDVAFAAAAACGMGLELEAATLAAALRAAPDLPADAWLSLNVSPALLVDGVSLPRILAGHARPIVLEVTEHEQIDDYEALHRARRALGSDVRIAVDDAGAGVANFNHLVGLRPDFLKIDIGLVRGVTDDPGRRAVVVGLVHFAAEAGCHVIAEGIETSQERATVAELGVTLGQGYLLARPALASAWNTETSNGRQAKGRPGRRIASTNPFSGGSPVTIGA